MVEGGLALLGCLTFSQVPSHILSSLELNFCPLTSCHHKGKQRANTGLVTTGMQFGSIQASTQAPFQCVCDTIYQPVAENSVIPSCRLPSGQRSACLQAVLA